MQKETFIIRTEWYEAISELEPTDKARILDNLFAYHCDMPITLDTITVKLVWKLIEPTLSRNIETYDRRKETSVINGKKGGRPQEKTKIIQKYPNETQAETCLPIKTLSDSVYVSVSDSVYVSESESDVSHTPSEKITDTPEYILPAPGDPAQQAFYEQEICMKLQYPMDEVKLIHNKWISARYGKLMTLKQARMDFVGYASAFRINSPRGKPAGTRQQSQPQITSSYI